MSIFTRPESPPPRQPSPEPQYTPLPSPHVRARQRTASSQHSSSSHAPATPPGLAVHRQHKPIPSARSYDHLHGAQEPRIRNTRSRSTLTASPPATPRSLPLPSPSRSQFSESPHRRTLSNAIPYLSPPPSPTLAAPPPPVPPIPAFVLNSPAHYKPAPSPQPATILPIHLPDLGTIPSLAESAHTTRKHATPPSSSRKHYVSPDKHHSMGMTCLKFFSLRNSKRRNTQATEA
ncbi:hypothetical protein DXG03_000299 [Asterophora parasitica]|uniref:Uncharacterized protein n=1 Tax=Asterophora parasitica TaxID=117018 RepID=A0A9P7GGM9_9AGAR|nr:hypothetical protein DXG03_000299 [Asterophora parasitica]